MIRNIQIWKKYRNISQKNGGNYTNRIVKRSHFYNKENGMEEEYLIQQKTKNTNEKPQVSRDYSRIIFCIFVILYEGTLYS